VSDYQQVQYSYGPCKGFTLEMPSALAAVAGTLSLRVTDAGNVVDVATGKVRPSIKVVRRPEPPKPAKTPRRRRGVPKQQPAVEPPAFQAAVG
jgi:hypothetical protein